MSSHKLLKESNSDFGKYSFCETITATGSSPWHLRLLTEVGRKLGGGADTPSLCGRKVCWDLSVELTRHHLSHSCKKCVEILLRDVDDESLLTR